MHDAPSTTRRTTDRFCEPRSRVDVCTLCISASGRQAPAFSRGVDLTSSCGTRTEGVKAFASTEGWRSTSLPESGSRIFMAPTVRDSWIAERLESVRHNPCARMRPCLLTSGQLLEGAPGDGNARSQP